MSSILEALKELEGDQARSSKKATSLVDAPRERERSLNALIPLTGGLAVGVVAFGLYAWSPSFVGSPPAPPPAPSAGAPPEPTTPPRSPEWLERAEAPRARVAPPPGAAVPARPERAAAAVETPATDGATSRSAPAPSKVAATRSAGDQQVQLEGLGFSAHAHQRTVTLVVNGRRATLHQRESLGGVEVQLIMADGVYLRRGSEVFFVNWPR